MKIYSIQYLRALAVLLVVYCHAIDTQMLYGVSWQQNFYSLQNFGAIGVDIFFVISGFIIAYITQNTAGHAGAFNFLKKRFIRINPSYYFASGLVLIIALVRHQHPLWDVIKTVTILPIFDRGIEFWSGLLYVGWTLSFEWLFYLIYDVLIYFSVQNKNSYLIIILIILSLLGFVHPVNNIQYTFITNPIILEFGFGVFIAWLYKNIKGSMQLAILLLALGVVGFGLNVIVGYGNLSEAPFILAGKYCWPRVVYWGLPSAFLVAGALFYEKAMPGGIFKSKYLTLLGDASFSIYLVHPIFFMLVELLPGKMHNALQQINPDLLIVILVILATLCGVLYYKIAERFLIKKFNQIIK
jgi:exopolysaccharide production protein ExoZ